MKTFVAVFVLVLAGSGVAFAQQTTTSPFGPATLSPSVPGSPSTYDLPGGMRYNPFPTTAGVPGASLFNPFPVTTTPGISSATALTGQGSQVLGTGGTSSMFNGMFGMNPAALNPFSLFGTPITLNPFSLFFGNTAIAPRPVIQTTPGG